MTSSSLRSNAENPKKYTAILFDLDGTLLDTANDLGEALNFVLNKHGLQSVDREKYRPVASDGAKGLLELGFGDKLASFDYEELRHQFLKHYEENIAVHTKLYNGIEALIKHLDDNTIPWGIVTNKPEYLSKILVPKFPQFNACRSLIAGDTLPQRKPDPAPLLHACNQMSVDPLDCIYVGDAPRDIEAGNRAGMFTIIAEWGYIINVSDCESWDANLTTVNPADIWLMIN
jgi:phosphoglycolate phosphatase